MKQFVIKLLYFTIGMIFLFLFYILSFSNGQIDFYYKRVSSPLQHSLIVGSSRSAQGIIPSEISDHLNRHSKFERNIYNFSFAASYSPYGEVYFNSIKKKVDSLTRNGVFIITVDPGSISGNGNELETDRKLSFLSDLESVTASPNLRYIFNPRQPYWTKLLYNCFFGKGYLHDDGWLEMRIPNDSLTRHIRLEMKLRSKYGIGYNISAYRLNYLKKTVEYLKKFGSVYIVVMPNHPVVQDRFRKSVPMFTDIMEEISEYYNVEFLDFSKHADKYEYTDGTHLTSKSAKSFSNELALKILKTIKN